MSELVGLTEFNIYTYIYISIQSKYIYIYISRTKKKDIYVIKTLHRPVPLEHHLYADKEIYKIVDKKKKFLGNKYAVVIIIVVVSSLFWK